VPDNATCCGLSVLLSLTVRFAVKVPIALGRKVTVIVQDSPEPRLVPQVLVWENCVGLVPVRLMLEMLSAPGPVLVSIVVRVRKPRFADVEPKLRM
jgi:uncharacterized membrane protein YecN with MAPEG domain